MTGSGFHQFPNLSQVLTFHPYRDRTHGVNPGRCGLLPFRNHEPNGCRVIDGRVGVRHGADGGKSPSGGGLGPRGDGFLVFLTGLTQMNVGVDEAGRHYQPRGVDLPSVHRRACVLHQGKDGPVHKEEIQNPIQALGRIDHPSTSNQ